VSLNAAQIDKRLYQPLYAGVVEEVSFRFAHEIGVAYV
jgi:hypothetical protein